MEPSPRSDLCLPNFGATTQNALCWKMLLEDLSLSPLQVFSWQQTLEFSHKLAASQVGSLLHPTLFDNLRDAFHHGVNNFCSSICWALTSLSHHMSRDCSGASAHGIPVIIELLRQHLQGTHAYEVHCPDTAYSVGIVSCTYHHWSMPYSMTRRYCQLPVSGRRMHRFAVQTGLTWFAFCHWPFFVWGTAC